MRRLVRILFWENYWEEVENKNYHEEFENLQAQVDVLEKLIKEKVGIQEERFGKKNVLLKEDNKKKRKIKEGWRKKEEKIVTADHEFNGNFNDFILSQDALFTGTSKGKENGEKEKDIIAEKEVSINFVSENLHAKEVDEAVDKTMEIPKIDFDRPRLDKGNEEEDSLLLKEEIRKIEKLFQQEIIEEDDEIKEVATDTCLIEGGEFTAIIKEKEIEVIVDLSKNFNVSNEADFCEGEMVKGSEEREMVRCNNNMLQAEIQIVAAAKKKEVTHDFICFNEEKDVNYCFPKLHSAEWWELNFVNKGRKRGRMKESRDRILQAKGKQNVHNDEVEKWIQHEHSIFKFS